MGNHHLYRLVCHFLGDSNGTLPAKQKSVVVVVVSKLNAWVSLLSDSIISKQTVTRTTMCHHFYLKDLSLSRYWQGVVGT